MSPVTIGCIGLVAVLILMFLRMPVGFAFAVVGSWGIWYFRGTEAMFGSIMAIPYTTVGSYMWTVMPMFIFMGYLAMQAGLAEEFYEGVRKWMGQFRGGLALSVILGNTAFGAVSGDAVSAAVTFSTISLPEMRKYKYADSLTVGAIAAGSVLAIIIPPSIGFIMFGAITATSIGELFIAGIVPGLILTVLYLITVYLLCLLNPGLGPPGPKTTWMEKIKAAPGMWAIVFIFLVMIGGLYLGLFTPTEAGAVGAFVVLILGIARRKLTWQGFRETILRAGLTTGLIFFIIIGVHIFGVFVTMTGLPVSLAEAMVNLSESAIVIMLLIAVAYFFLGTFMDIVSVMLLTVPILFPVVREVGGNPLVFGVAVVLMTTTGGITPPYGMTVFAMAGALKDKDVPMYTIFRGAMPFLIPILICEALVIFIPPISAWLPSMMWK